MFRQCVDPSEAGKLKYTIIKFNFFFNHFFKKIEFMSVIFNQVS